MRFVRAMSILFVLLLAVSSAGTVAAQEDDSPYDSLTLTETFLNEILQDILAQSVPAQPNTDLSFVIDLSPGEVVLVASSTGPGGNTLDVSLTLVPSVANGTLQWEATDLLLNNFPIDISQANGVDTGAVDSLDAIMGDQAGGEVVSFDVTDTEARMVWVREEPEGPVTNVVDNLISMTFTEAKINGYDWMVNPTDPNVVASTLDLQPGQGVFTVDYDYGNQNTARGTYTLIPTMNKGLVTWRVIADLDGANDSPAAAVITTWNAFFDQFYASVAMVDALITDNAVTFTWDMLQFDNEAQQVATDVTYEVTEAEITEELANILGDSVTAFVVDFRPGEVVIAWGSPMPDGSTLNFALGLAPSLVGGTVEWDLTTLTINGQAVNEPVRSNPVDTFNNALTTGATGWTSSTEVISLDINDDRIQVVVRYR